MEETREGLRLDELAREAGVASTTVRLYQHRGLLRAPRLVGRTGYYDSSHLARLRLIGRLQDEGFSLAGIGRLLESWEQGRDLSDLVGVERELDQLLGRPAPVILDPSELAAYFPPGSLTPELLDRALRAGLVSATDDGRFQVTDPRFVETGAALARLGLPLKAIVEEWEHLVVHTDAIAERFLSVFEAHLLPENWPDLPEGGDDLQVEALASTLAQLRTLAGEVLLAALDTSMAGIGARRLAGLLPPAGGPHGQDSDER